MALLLGDDTLEEARAFAEEERRRQREERQRQAAPTFDFSQPVGGSPTTYDGGFSGWGGQNVFTPEGPQQPQGLTAYGETVNGQPTFVNAEGFVVDSTGAYAPSNTWDSYNASADVLTNTPAPPVADNGYGFEGQNWYAPAANVEGPVDPNWSAAPTYEPPPPEQIDWRSNFGGDIGVGGPAHKNIFERAAGAVTSIPGKVWDWQNDVNARLAEPDNQPSSFLDAVTTGGPRNVYSLTGKKPEELPYGTGYLASAAVDPLTYAPFGLAGKGPKALQSLAGPILDASANPLRRVGTELAVNTAGLAGSEIAGKAAAKYTDNPWLTGAAAIGGGLLAGAGVLAAPTAIRAGAKGAKGALGALEAGHAALMEPTAVGARGMTTEPMVFDRGRIAGAPERRVIPDSYDLNNQFIVRASPDARGGMIVTSGNKQVGALTSVDDGLGNQVWRIDIPGRTPTFVKNPDAGIAAIKKANGGIPEPLAKDRLWFHSTNDMSYDLPDPDLAVGTQTGITQGPGIYMASDPAKSAGNYGNRTFVSEFDGNVLDLTKPADPAQWAMIRDDLQSRLEAAGLASDEVKFAFKPERLAAKGRSELAAADNGYGYRDALAREVEKDLRANWGEWAALPPEEANAVIGKRFVEMLDTDPSPKSIAMAMVNDSLAANGVDALFHHSPRADGDVLIVLNGEKARAVADIKNAADAVKKGETLDQILAHVEAHTTVANSVMKQPGVSFGGTKGDWTAIRTGDDKIPQGFIRRAPDGQWEVAPLGSGPLLGKFATEDEAVQQLVTTKLASARTFRDIGPTKPGEIGGGADLPQNAGFGPAASGVTPPPRGPTATGAPGPGNAGLGDVYYHGTTKPVGQELQPNGLGVTFVSPSPAEAKLFAGPTAEGRVIPVNIKAKRIFDGRNPADLDAIGATFEDRLFDSAYVENADWLNKMRAAGYDGFKTQDISQLHVTAGVTGAKGTENIGLFNSADAVPLRGGMAAPGTGSGLDQPVATRPPSPAASGVTPPPRVPTATGAPNAEYTSGTNKILTALKEETRIRRGGTARAEITTGRAEQLGGVADVIRAGGEAPTDVISSAYGAAKTGPLRKTFAPAIELTPAEKDAVQQAVLDRIARGEAPTTDIFRMGARDSALEKLINGEGLQPAEIKWVRNTFGEDIAKAVQEANPGRPSAVAGFSDADLNAIEARRKFGETQIAREEVRAKNQHALADSFQERANMNPTNKRLQELADQSRARAITAENKANQLELEKVQEWEQVSKAKAERDAQRATERANRAATDKQMAKDVADAKAKRDALITELKADQKAGKAADQAQLRAIRDARIDAEKKAAAWKKYTADADAREIAQSRKYAADVAAKNERAAQRDLAKQNRAEVRAAEKADKANPNDEMLRAKATKIADEKITDPKLRAAVDESIDYWIKGNRTLLDAIGPTEHEIAANVRATLTGDVPDSYVTSLLHRKGFLASALEGQGVEPKLAKKIADTLVDRELALRWPPGSVPADVQASIDAAKALPYGSGGAMSGLASVSQELKNSQFGLGDISVWGNQVLKAVTTGGPHIFAGAVNRLLNLAHLGIDKIDTDVRLARRIQNQLDGLGTGAMTGMTDLSHEGTILQRLGPLGKAIDRPVVAATRFLTDFQFKTVLGNIRSLNMEGNLVLAKLAGADITNPAVRKTAADFANFNTSYWHPALNATRRETEKALLLTPSMRRAQVAQITKVAQGLISGNRVERVLAATTLATFAGSVLAAQKLLNDYAGVGDFEWNPGKKGFGNVTLAIKDSAGRNIVINPFPQEQVLKAISRSIAILQDEQGKGGWDEIAKEWGKLALSSSSPAIQPFEKVAGFGYQPDKGWRFGDFGEGMSPGERALSALPVPPIVGQTRQEGLDALRTPLNVLGFNNYPEADYSEFARKVKADPEFGGKPYAELEPWQKKIADARYPQAASTDPGWKQLEEIDRTRLDNERRAVTETPPASDPKGFREQVTNIQGNAAIERSRVDKDFQLFKSGQRQPKDTNEAALFAYYDLFDKPGMKRADGKLTDAFDPAEQALRASWTPEQRAFVDRNTGLSEHVPEVQKLYADRKRIEDSGYWDLKDKAWADLAEMGDYAQFDLTPGMKYGDWYQMHLANTAKRLVEEKGYDPTAAEARAKTIMSSWKPVSAFNEWYKKDYLYPWMDGKQDVVRLIMDWGYNDFDKATQEWLAKQ